MKKESSITTQLNISNNDIVTMLIEEKKEQLRDEIKRLSADAKVLLQPYIDSLIERVQEFYDSEEMIAFKNQVYNFAKLYNPDIEIKLIGAQSASLDIGKEFKYIYRGNKAKFNIPSLSITSVKEDEEDKIIDFTHGDIYYPPFLNKVFSLEISNEDECAYIKIYALIDKYINQMNNSGLMKDQMVAKMTKQAILNNPDLLAIRDSVLKLEE